MASGSVHPELMGNTGRTEPEAGAAAAAGAASTSRVTGTAAPAAAGAAEGALGYAEHTVKEQAVPSVFTCISRAYGLRTALSMPARAAVVATEEWEEPAEVAAVAVAERPGAMQGEQFTLQRYEGEGAEGAPRVEGGEATAATEAVHIVVKQ